MQHHSRLSIGRLACGFAGSIQRDRNCRRGGAWLSLWLALAVFSGCEGEILDRTYGVRRGAVGGPSVNGTAVLSEMFQQAGHRVVSKRSLSNSVRENADVIVWFPNDFVPPKDEVMSWLEEWMSDDPTRTLIYVGCDFDAATLYWDAVIGSAPAKDQVEMRRRRSRDALRHKIDRSEHSEPLECDWFIYDPSTPKRTVKSLEGPWAEGVDPEKAEIVLHGRLDPQLIGAEDVLLESDEDVLVSEMYDEWTGSRTIFVANGSFLLNYPLVNHEHRKLAAKLVAEFEPSQTIVFLESGPGGPPIRQHDPELNVPTTLTVFTVWPINVVLLHFAVVLIVWSMTRWPIFGRPKRHTRDSISDFGKHVDALGELLAKTGDKKFAEDRLAQYRQQRGDTK